MQTIKFRAQFTLSMTSLKRILYNFCGLFLAHVTACNYAPALADSSTPDVNSKLSQSSQQFLKLDQHGKPLKKLAEDQIWSCVLDNQTGLTWEIKLNDGKLQDAHQTYSWYVSNPKLNGGFAGYDNKGKCVLSRCNTQAYINAINQQKLCGSDQWRLPSREELRSIVDYQLKYPGPTIYKSYFPNTLSQFYWSSIPDANDIDSAWGIGFSFGYDYAYFKSDLGYVRLVNEHIK